MRGFLGRIGLVLSVAVLATLLPAWTPPAAACTPRTFRELGPAPNDLPPPEPPADDGTGIEVEPVPYDPWTVTPPPPRCSYVYNMDFPIVGDWDFLSTFGQVRDAGERWHAGVDIGAQKLSSVVAVRSGTLTQVNRNGAGDCCWLAVQHDDGWRSLYIHLNNDLSETDDGTGVGIVPGLQLGDRVERGQVIGYVGDSGNAEPAVPHIHFELRTPWLESVDPLPSLRRAARRPVSGFADLEEPPYRHDGPFADDDGQIDEPLVSMAVSLGVPLGCDPYGLMWCPLDPADAATAEAWVRALTLDRLDPATHAPPEPLPDEFEPIEGDAPSMFIPVFVPDDHERVRQLRICEENCSDLVTRSDVGVLLAIDNTEDPEVLLDRLYESGQVDGCDGIPQPHDEPLSRLRLLRMLMRAFGYLETAPCTLIS